jgi:mono/diheme cytochrome c family protein
VTRPFFLRILGVASVFSVVFAGAAHAAMNEQAVAQSAPAAAHSPAPARILMAQAGRPVSYSESQASRGEKIFKEVCADCHGSNLRGGLIGGPPLTGSAFEEKYFKGTPASAIFAFTSTLMPPDAPGQFSPAEYADMIAFILRENGVQTNGSPLPTNQNALDQMIIDK